MPGERSLVKGSTEKKDFPIQRMNKIQTIFFLFLLVASSPGQKYVSGEITRDTHWIGDIHVNGDIIVPKGVILSIESGSRILFKPKTDVLHSGVDKERAELVVNGILLARGNSASSPIIFTSEAANAQMNDWYGIIIKNLYDKSVLQNCIVEFAYKGITCYGSAPQIQSCELRFNYNSGLSCEVRANPRMKRSVIMGNGFAGINCELASSPVISECVITQNNYGVIVLSRSQPDLGHSPAEGNVSKGKNRIFNNFDFNVYNHSINNIYAQNNLWNTTDPDEIRFTLYDNLKNPSYGQVYFQPIYLKKKKRKPLFPAIVLEPGQPTPSALPPRRPVQQSPVKKDTISPPKVELPGDTVAVSNFPPLSPPDTIKKVKPETVFVYRLPEKKEEKKAPEQKIQEPILEAFLDSGKREYIKRAVPKYPEIYLKTGTEGEVYIEVVVGRDGRIKSHRVLRSGGELFTVAAERALQKYRYKPGTFKGKPVSYKIVELFRFKRSIPE